MERAIRRPRAGASRRQPQAPARAWEEELAAGRAAAVGRLASGVAHELGSPLTVIVGCSHLVLDALPSGHPSAALLRSIQRSAGRCQELLRSLLEFSRNDPSATSRFELAGPLAAALELVGPLARHRCLVVRADLGSRAMPLLGQPAQLQTAFVHLAAHLVECAAAGGTFRLRARPAEGWAEVALRAEAGGGAMPCRGGDVSPVGLALAQEVVRRHGGRVEHGGLGFLVRLPLAEAA